jgi:Concanavalin A-like lectin/glucanases superfamily/Bacterial tandem repeat domain 1
MPPTKMRSRTRADSFVEVRLIVLLLSLAVLAIATVPSIVRAIDANGDNLDDAWESQYGLTTNAYDPAHLAAWWQFDGPTNVADRSTNHVNGTLEHFPANSFGPGLFSNALYFTPKAQVTFPPKPPLDATHGFTFSTWIKFADGAHGPAAVSAWNDAANNAWVLMTTADGDPEAVFSDAQGHSITIGPGDDPISLYNADWHHLVVTTTEQGAVVLYVDGEAQAIGSVSAWKPVAPQAFSFGGPVDSGAPNYALDDTRWYTRALGPREILQLPVTYSDLSGNGVSVYEAAQRHLNPYQAYPLSILTSGTSTSTNTAATNAPAAGTNLDFTPWMSNPDLDKFLSQYDTVPPGHHPNYWDKGHWMYGVEGRWADNRLEYRIAYGAHNVHHAGLWWYWYINQPEEMFMRRAATYSKDGFVLAHSNYFTMPDGTRRYQGVWHKVVPDKPPTP